MSGAGNCYDNAFMESCFGTIKTEPEMTPYEDSTEALHEVSRSMRYDNADRLHASLDYVTPIPFETQSTLPI